jgi:multiple sugar transport system permease protein
MYLLPAAAFLGLLGVFPLYELVRMSVSEVDFSNIATGDWESVGADNFRALDDSGRFGDASRNTVIFVIIVVSMSMIGGLFVATIIRRPTLPRRTLQALLIFAWTLPPIVSGSVWKFMLFTDGVLNDILVRFGREPTLFLVDSNIALVSVAVVNAWQALPFAAIILKAAMLDVPSEVLEAAEVDGASKWRSFVHVTLPHMMPVILVLTVLISVYALRSFDLIYVMTNGGPGTATTTLPYLAYREAFEFGNFGVAGAIAVVAGVVIAIAAVLYVWLTNRAEART